MEGGREGGREGREKTLNPKPSTLKRQSERGREEENGLWRCRNVCKIPDPGWI